MFYVFQMKEETFAIKKTRIYANTTIIREGMAISASDGQNGRVGPLGGVVAEEAKITIFSQLWAGVAKLVRGGFQWLKRRWKAKNMLIIFQISILT